MHNEEYDSELDGGSGGEGGDDLLQEVWMSLSTIKQVFVNGHWKTTVPLQLSYLTLTLITGEDLIRIYTSVNIVSNTKSFRHEKELRHGGRGCSKIWSCKRMHLH